MNRRSFLLGAAASLVAVPVAPDVLQHLVDPLPHPWDGWHLTGYDRVGDRTFIVRFRVHDEQIYVEKMEDFTADEIRYRWRVAAPEIAKLWGTSGK
jgi:hypothetical protein